MPGAISGAPSGAGCALEPLSMPHDLQRRRTMTRLRWGLILALASTVALAGAAISERAVARGASVSDALAAKAAKAPAEPAAAKPAPAATATAKLESTEDPKLSGTVTFTQRTGAVR